MGTYVTASILYGITVFEKEDEDRIEEEEPDYYELLKVYPVLDYTYGGESSWDLSEMTAMVYVKRSEIVSYSNAAFPLDIAQFTHLAPNPQELEQLDQFKTVHLVNKVIGSQGWHLVWNRG